MSGREGYSEIAYALLPEYWNRGIGKSVLKKIIEEWGSEVRRIGLGFNNHHQQIKEKFQCFGGKELKKFYATAKPKNIFSWSLLEKSGFEPAKIGVENPNNPIYFNIEEFESPSFESVFDYYSKIEHYIEKLYQEGGKKLILPCE